MSGVPTATRRIRARHLTANSVPGFFVPMFRTRNDRELSLRKRIMALRSPVALCLEESPAPPTPGFSFARNRLQ